tara:strand:+ start:92 stop:277 length:186 start_codon:yes stop_codon:yes gene_type:complete
MDKQTDYMRLILDWVDSCPMANEISSMQGGIVHIKVSTSKPVVEKESKLATEIAKFQMEND